MGLIEFYLFEGLTSFGFQCAAPGLLGVYTDVSHYLGWIEEHTGLDSTIVQQIHTNTTIKPAGAKNLNVFVVFDFLKKF